MAKRKKKAKSSDEISTENELLKLKMMAEFGGNFMGSEDIPPEIEHQFLKQIISFHKLHDSSEMITIYKYIGEPEYNHVSDMADKEIAKELAKLLKQLNKNNIALSVLADTPKRDIYKFITEELFKLEIEEIRIKGWVNNFIYEEFHPNAEYDIRTAVFYCLQFIFNKDSLFFDEHFSEDMKDNLGLSMDSEEFKIKVSALWQQFYNIKLDQYDVANSEVDKDNGTAHIYCNVSYKTQTEKGKRFKTENITVEFVLEQSKTMESWWEVKQVICNLF